MANLQKIIGLITVFFFLTSTLRAGEADNVAENNQKTKCNVLVYTTSNVLSKGESTPIIIEIQNNTGSTIKLTFFDCISFNYKHHKFKSQETGWSVLYFTDNNPKMIVRSDKVNIKALTIKSGENAFLKAEISRRDLGEGVNKIQAALLFDGDDVANSPENGPVIDAR